MSSIDDKIRNLSDDFRCVEGCYVPIEKKEEPVSYKEVIWNYLRSFIVQYLK